MVPPGGDSLFLWTLATWSWFAGSVGFWLSPVLRRFLAHVRVPDPSGTSLSLHQCIRIITLSQFEEVTCMSDETLVPMKMLRTE